MPAATYQVNRDLRSNPTPEIQAEAFQILASVVLNATQGYGLNLQDVSLDGAGRLRVRISEPLPPAEVESFLGDIIEV